MTDPSRGRRAATMPSEGSRPRSPRPARSPTALARGASPSRRAAGRAQARPSTTTWGLDTEGGDEEVGGDAVPRAPGRSWGARVHHRPSRWRKIRPSRRRRSAASVAAGVPRAGAGHRSVEPDALVRRGRTGGRRPARAADRPGSPRRSNRGRWPESLPRPRRDTPGRDRGRGRRAGAVPVTIAGRPGQSVGPLHELVAEA